MSNFAAAGGTHALHLTVGEGRKIVVVNEAFGLFYSYSINLLLLLGGA